MVRPTQTLFSFLLINSFFISGITALPTPDTNDLATRDAAPGIEDLEVYHAATELTTREAAPEDLAEDDIEVIYDLLPRSEGLFARQSAIKGPPPDPKKQPGDGQGKWKAKSAGAKDYLIKAKAKALAIAADAVGMDNAAKAMNHYLGNSGKDYRVNVPAMLRDLKNFKSAVRATAQNSAKGAYKKAGVDGTATFVTPWKVYGYGTGNFNKDWYYGIGAFSYSVSGQVSRNKAGKATLYYVVNVFDRYNFDTGKSVTIGGKTVKDSEMGRLHVVGLAREFIQRGYSAVSTVTNYDPKKTLPAPNSNNRPRGG